jgi:hypothetical protein
VSACPVNRHPASDRARLAARSPRRRPAVSERAFARAERRPRPDLRVLLPVPRITQVSPLVSSAGLALQLHPPSIPGSKFNSVPGCSAGLRASEVSSSISVFGLIPSFRICKRHNYSDNSHPTTPLPIAVWTCYPRTTCRGTPTSLPLHTLPANPRPRANTVQPPHHSPHPIHLAQPPLEHPPSRASAGTPPTVARATSPSRRSGSRNGILM